jgi:hypothetical protein
MKVVAVPSILAKQNDGGYWKEPHRFYTAKYKATVWQLMILAELGADAYAWNIGSEVSTVSGNVAMKKMQRASVPDVAKGGVLVASRELQERRHVL